MGALQEADEVGGVVREGEVRDLARRGELQGESSVMLCSGCCPTSVQCFQAGSKKPFIMKYPLCRTLLFQRYRWISRLLKLLPVSHNLVNFCLLKRPSIYIFAR
jgi:hypothetical protein